MNRILDIESRKELCKAIDENKQDFVGKLSKHTNSKSHSKFSNSVVDVYKLLDNWYGDINTQYVRVKLSELNEIEKMVSAPDMFDKMSEMNTPFSGVTSGTWTHQEILLLIEALELCKENKNVIVERVDTKTKAIDSLIEAYEVAQFDEFFKKYEDAALKSRSLASLNFDQKAIFRKLCFSKFL